jgi:hypothetical protein
LTYLQSTGEFGDEYQFYMKEQWGERNMFQPHIAIPECQDETKLPQKDGVVVRKMQDRVLNGDFAGVIPTGNLSSTCQLLTDEANCVAFGGCEWRGDFNGRCRKQVNATEMPTYHPTLSPSSLPTVDPTSVPTTTPLPGIEILQSSPMPLVISENGSMTSSFTVQLRAEPLSRVWVEFNSKFGHGT